jgi:ABC-type multidrug transport system ATPase subunit
MIVARGLTRRCGSVTAVDDLSFTVRPGVVTGFLGPNGAGKSTAMRLTLGLDHGAGRTEFDGRSHAELTTRPVRSACCRAPGPLVAVIGFPTIAETLMLLARVDPPIPFSSAAKLIATGAWSSPLALLGLVAVFLAASWVTLRRRDT